MAVDWSLGARPVNVMQSLQLLGAGQEQQRQQQEYDMKMQQEQAAAQRLATFNQGLIGAVDMQTGAVNQGAARLAYAQAGDGIGLMKFGADQSADFAKQRKAVAEPIAQTAWSVLQLPPEQQASAFYKYVDQFAQTNPAAAQFRDVPPEQIPQFLEAMLAEVGWLDDFQKDNKPEYRNVAFGDNVYDMRGVGNGGQPRPVITARGDEDSSPAQVSAPSSAIDYLRQNPSMSAAFDQKYGQGASAQVLGGRTSQSSGGFPG